MQFQLQSSLRSAGDTRGPGEKARRVVLRTVAALRGWNRSVLVDGTVVALLFLQMQCAELDTGSRFQTGVFRIWQRNEGAEPLPR